MLAPVARQFGLARAPQVMVAPARGARSWRVEPTKNVEQRRLAAAGRPEQHHELRRVDIEIDAAQRLHLDLAIR